jgi:peptide methionine sulfoxide reductase msrA/msrB
MTTDSRETSSTTTERPDAASQASSRSDPQHDQQTQDAYFAGGCFWGIERYFQGVDGVSATQVGYAQSKVPSPSYEQVCSGETDAAESVRVTFDPARVTLRTLALLLLDVIDPYSVNQQGNDTGRQYRSGMFFTSPAQQAVYDTALQQLAARARARPPSQSRNCAISTTPRTTIRITSTRTRAATAIFPLTRSSTSAAGSAISSACGS